MGHKRKFVDASHEKYTEPPKRKRTYTEADARLAKIYDELSSNKPEDRIAATKALLEQFSDRTNDFEGDIDGSPSIKKAFTRLVRGLCSSRKAARVGFFIALAELLRAHKDSKDLVDSCLDLVKRATEAEPGSKGQEKRDYEIGRAFGFHAVLQSGVFIQEDHRHVSKFGQLMEELLGMHDRKSWLREDIGKTIHDWIASNEAETVSHYSKPITSKLSHKHFAHSPEGIAIWLELRNKLPQTNIPRAIWTDRDPISKEDLPEIVKILLRMQDSAISDKASEKKSDQSGTRQVAPHFAWNVVLHSLIREDEHKGHTENRGESKFARVWEDGVDGGHFGRNASPEKKYLGLQILNGALSEAPAWSLRYSLSPDILTWLLSQRSKPERYLNAAAKATLDNLVSRSRNESRAAKDIIAAITYGPLSFEKFSGSSTVKSILTVVDDDTAQDLVDILLRFKATIESKDDKTAKSNQQAIVDHLSRMIRDREIKLSYSDGDCHPRWVSDILTHLAKFACQFKDAKLSDDAREQCRSALFSTLGHLLSTTPETAMRLPSWLAIKIHGNHRQALAVYHEADDEVVQTLNRAASSVKNEDQNNKVTPTFRAFNLLTSMTLLQAYGGDLEAIETLLELKVLRSGLAEKDASHREALEAIIDLILNLASKASLFHRKLAEQVFMVFAADLTHDALQTMLDILEQREGLSGQNALFEQGNQALDEEDGEEGNSEDDEVELIDDEESAEYQSGDEQDPEDTSNSPSNSESGPDSSDSGSSEVARFDRALASTLKTSNSDTAHKDQDGEKEDDDSSISDTSMTDSQMLALEPHLTAIFKGRVAAGQISSVQDQNADKKSKKGSENKRTAAQARENVVNFKNRVLDLLELWLKQHPSMPLTLNAVVPFLKLLRTTRNKQIAEKTIGVLRAFYDAAKRKGLPLHPGEDQLGHTKKQEGTGVSEAAASDDQLHDLLELMSSIHSEALRFGSKAHVSACSSASMFVARCMLLGVCQNQASSKSHDRNANTEQSHEWRKAIDKIYSETWNTALDNSGDMKRLNNNGMLPLGFWREWQEWQIEVFVSRSTNKKDEATSKVPKEIGKENIIGQKKTKASKKKKNEKKRKR